MQLEKGRAAGVPTGASRLDDPSDRRQISERIKSARRSAGLTQRQLAEKLDVSAGAVGQWETGGVPTAERLATLADSLRVSLDWLLGKSPNADELGTVQMEEDLQLIREARLLGVDLHKIVAEARQQRWIEENRDALADANAFLTTHGLWSDGKRQF
jgi:transcriptional regulator with XRE-family HTH domain